MRLFKAHMQPGSSSVEHLIAKVAPYVLVWMVNVVLILIVSVLFFGVLFLAFNLGLLIPVTEIRLFFEENAR